MKRHTLVVLLAAILTAGAIRAQSQAAQSALSDAQEALQKAKTAYNESRFDAARDLAQKASETDPRTRTSSSCWAKPITSLASWTRPWPPGSRR